MYIVYFLLLGTISFMLIDANKEGFWSSLAQSLSISLAPNNSTSSLIKN